MTMTTEQRPTITVTITAPWLEPPSRWSVLIETDNDATEFAVKFGKLRNAQTLLSFVGLKTAFIGVIYPESAELFVAEGTAYEIGSDVLKAIHRWMRETNIPIEDYLFTVSVTS